MLKGVAAGGLAEPGRDTAAGVIWIVLVRCSIRDLLDNQAQHSRDMTK